MPAEYPCIRLPEGKVMNNIYNYMVQDYNNNSEDDYFLKKPLECFVKAPRKFMKVKKIAEDEGHMGLKALNKRGDRYVEEFFQCWSDIELRHLTICCT